MFTNKEVSFMKSIGLDFDFNFLSDDEWCELEDVVGDALVERGIEKDGKPNEIGLMCEEILSKLP